MKWLAKLLFIAMCLTLLSCSAESILFLHNDTSESFEYKISAKVQREPEAPVSKSGALAQGEVIEAIHYFASEIERVDIEVRQKGKSQTRSFEGADLPGSLKYSSSGGVWSHIRVSDNGLTIGGGSGNWGADFQHRLGFLFAPCMGLFILIGIGTALLFRSSRRARENFILDGEQGSLPGS